MSKTVKFTAGDASIVLPLEVAVKASGLVKTLSEASEESELVVAIAVEGTKTTQEVLNIVKKFAEMNAEAQWTEVPKPVADIKSTLKGPENDFIENEIIKKDAAGSHDFKLAVLNVALFIQAEGLSASVSGWFATEMTKLCPKNKKATDNAENLRKFLNVESDFTEDEKVIIARHTDWPLEN